MKKVNQLDKLISDNLITIRKKCKKSLQEVGEACGVSKVMMFKYEKGNSKISAARLFLLSGYFNVPMVNFIMEIEK